MKMSHEDYLKRTATDIKTKLESLNVKHQIEIAKYETKREMLMSQLESIEKHIHYNEK